MVMRALGSRILAALLCTSLLAAADTAREFQRAGRLPEAETAYRAALATNARDLEAATGLATVVGWQGRHGEAETLWQAALALKPDAPDTQVGLARVRYWRHDLVGARAILDPLLITDPHHSEALTLAGAVAAAAGEVPRARDLYQRALVIAPNDTTAAQGLARLSVPILAWRLDAFGLRESWTAIYDLAWTVGLSAAYTDPDAGTFSTRLRERHFSDRKGRERTFGLGWGRALGSVALAVEGEATSDRVIAPRGDLGIELSWQATSWAAPLFGARRSWYVSDTVDLIRPGLRLTPVSGLDLEGRWLRSRSTEGGINGGGGLRGSYDCGPVALSAGWALTDEADPPLAPARVETWSGGIHGTIGNLLLRLDAEHEVRAETWTRRAVALGVGGKF